jgi:ABC-type oligopeptide transport system ATPase subunit
MIRLDAVTKRFPGTDAPAVDRLSLEVPEGELAVLVGPSGCGKTTTLKMINRIVEPTEGHIEVDGRDIMAVDPHTSCASTSATSSSRSGCSRTRPSPPTSPPCPGCSAGTRPASATGSTS